MAAMVAAGLALFWSLFAVVALAFGSFSVALLSLLLAVALLCLSRLAASPRLQH